MLRNKFVILTILIYTVIGDDSAIIEISNGKIQGSFNGQYYSFKGIPYAEPPIGENRFESPKPYLTKWNDIRDATKSGETCIRLDPVIIAHQKVLTGSEDCLFINVYTPSVKPEKLLPVIFFIHGGGYMFGSGDFLQENFLMDKKNFIYVTFNYRLGPLGFMSTEDDQITGNMGLKDQRLALEWLHENIKAFGGDSKNVLLSGFSAGAACVEYHLLQPNIEKYVSAAYSLSGSALCPWAFKNNLFENVKKVASSLKCSNVESSEEIKKCLKAVPATDIVNSSKEFFAFNYHPVVIWGPTIESSKSKDAMLLEMPENLIKKGKTANIPYLSSFVSEDGAFINAELLYQKEDGTNDLDYFNKHNKELLPKMLFYEDQFKDEIELKKYTEKLYEDVGITDGTITIDNFNKLSKIATEVVMENCIKESWKLHSEYSSNKIYCYKYDYPSQFSLGNMMANRTDISFGCVHGDDVFLMFNYAARDFDMLNEVEKSHSTNFLKLLETFVKTGVPQFGDVTFPENSKKSDGVKYLHILEKDVNVENLV